MTNIALNNARLTDALERDILEATMTQQTVAHPFAAIKRAVGAFFDFIDEVQETMNQARATSNRFSGSQW
ncbi:hypothetical protein [Achromobacter aloeverae]|uniref:Uncharacterized protein n=1 Tax=Achromobacter aloeverae TaxID=1750518 RepID=A0A4Q1HJR0_9BURK|nr:hypothetical protein [Achromobacter aloeverae]RXN90354.1 hypothetical protein C7R54_12630 [Achromobacter aloeverae]